MENKISLLVFSPYYPPHIGGLENHAEQFTAHMASAGYSISIFTPHIPSSSLVDEYISSNIHIIRFPAFEIITGYPVPKFWQKLFWQQLRESRKESFGVVISRTRFFLTSGMAWLYARTTGIKYLHIEHGSDYVQLSNPVICILAKFYDKTFGRFVLDHADAVIANSKASGRFVQLLTHQKITPSIIYRGVEKNHIEEIFPDITIKNNYSGKTIITYAGRLISGKGVADLLQAMYFLSSYEGEKQRLQLIIIGDGPQRQELEHLVEQLNIKNFVSFLGEKTPDEVISIIKSSDIIVNPSYTEGLPSSLLEASICKKAIIATDVGGTSEIIQNNVSGILITPRNSEELADAIRLLSNDEQKRHDLGIHAYVFICDTFSWDTAVQKYKAVFNSLKN
ncbi:MAG: glycosyltransferase family 4 protein [Candidatus Andersenbacteria bacterium]